MPDAIAAPDPDRQRVLDRLTDLFTPEQAEAWIALPNRSLSGETPEHRIAAGRVDDVLALIEAMDAGVYS